MHQTEGLIDIFLQPGDFFVADAQYQLRTVLGSCVSITLWHPLLRVGAMSHFLLPSRGGAADAANRDARYGDEVLPLMLAELGRHGIAPAQCQGKIFGGGNMFPSNRRTGPLAVGQRNGKAALALMCQYGIPVVSESLFGIGHRQIIFDIRNGDVWCQQIAPNATGLEPEGDLL
ncbi:MAG: chemotaxis protein CheD [Rhodoferax sp.]